MKRRADIVWRRVDDSVVALDLKTSRYYSFNASGAALWELLQDDTDESAMAKALVVAHGIDEATATEDSRTFIEQLRENGLLEA